MQLTSLKERENHIKKIENLLRGNSKTPLEQYAVVYSAYLYRACHAQSKKDFINKAIKTLSEERKLFLSYALNDGWSLTVFLAESVTDEQLLAFLKYFCGSTFKSGIFPTPESEAELVAKLMNIQKEELVADFGSGFGTFLQVTNDIAPESNYFGVELAPWAKEITLIKSELFKRKSIVECNNMFAINQTLSFDKIFSDPPLGNIATGFHGNQIWADNDTISSIPGMERAKSYAWPVAALMLNHLNQNGTAIEAVNMGSLFSNLEKEIRKYFIENYFIKAIIALPRKLSAEHSVQTALIVFDKAQHSCVRMLDARSLFCEGRRQNTLSEQNINDICKGLTEDSDFSKIVSIDNIRKNDYVLNPERYFQNKVVIKNGVSFGNVIKKITRGASLTAAQLDGMVSDVPSDTQYLMLSNIQDGLISPDLPYLKELDKKYERYLVHNGDLILSKSGAPFKSAVAGFPNDRKVVGSGNLYIIELDKAKINPFFLQAFLESEDGITTLKKISAGSVLPTVSLEALKEMIIPLPPLEIQDAIAQEYQIKEDTVKVLIRRLEKARGELKEVYREGGIGAVD